MRILFAGALALTLSSATAIARDIPPSGLAISDVVTWLQGIGYATEVVADKDGTSHARTTYNGVRVGVYMFDCHDGRCGSLQFSAGWNTHGSF